MNLNAIFSMLSKRGYTYFEGTCSPTNDYFHIDFSTGYNGRGKSFILDINEDSDENAIVKSILALDELEVSK